MRMVEFITPDASRAARALARLTQNEVASDSGVSIKTLRACEAGNQPEIGTMSRLRRFYDHIGIEFLGWLDVTTNKTSGVGVRWKFSVPTQHGRVLWHMEPTPYAFAAARGLLGIERQQLAEMVGLSPRKISNLETGDPQTKNTVEIIRSYYEGAGIQFLGSADTSSAAFLGVGVRWDRRSSIRRYELDAARP